MDKDRAQADFAAKFRVDDLHLRRVGTWDLSLRPGQLTLGAMVVSVRSGALGFAGLTAAEQADMGAAFALAERLACDTFGAARINLLCLMMQDPIVHFHVLPRYAAPQERFGATWVDDDWPGPPKVGPLVTPDAVLTQIRSTLLAAV